MKLFVLFMLLKTLPCAVATVILLPLYIYPTPNAWTPIYNAVHFHPHVTFQIIVNPDSGPGTTTYPDSNYIAGVAKLNSYPNVQLIGYVHTLYTHASYSALTTNITRYAHWSNYQKANIAIAGIFFDEVLATPNEAAFAYIKKATAFAYRTIPSSDTPVVLNPGTLASTKTGTNYFNVADTIVEFEDDYAHYQGVKTVQSVGSYASQSAIIVNELPSQGVDLMSLVKTAVKGGIAAVYFTKGCCYGDLSLLGELAKDVANS